MLRHVTGAILLTLTVFARLRILGLKPGALILTQACAWSAVSAWQVQPHVHPVAVGFEMTAGITNLAQFSAYLAAMIAADRLCSFVNKSSFRDHPRKDERRAEAERRRRVVTAAALLGMVAFYVSSPHASSARNLAFTDDRGLQFAVLFFCGVQLVRVARIGVIGELLRRHRESSLRLRVAMACLTVCMALMVVSLVLRAAIVTVGFGDASAGVLSTLASAIGVVLAVVGMAGPYSRLYAAWQEAVAGATNTREAIARLLALAGDRRASRRQRAVSLWAPRQLQEARTKLAPGDIPVWDSEAFNRSA